MKRTENKMPLKHFRTVFQLAIKYGILILSLWFIPFPMLAQQTITLDECFDLATKNYPLAQQSTLFHNQSQLDIEAINTGKLPQLDINGQASYQSDVTSLPIQLPNATVEPPNKDQYRVTLDINQLIYNGGLTDATSHVHEAMSKINQQQVEVTLYELKNQVNQLFLSILLLQENRDLLLAKEKQLKARLEEVKAGVKYGALLASAEQTLVAELLSIKQQFIELGFNRSALIKRLSLVIGKELSADINLVRPEIFLSDRDSNRPETLLFDLQREKVDYTSNLISKSKLPRIYVFAQGGYGNPGLNMLDNSFNAFYMTGLKLNWNLFDWNASKFEKQSLEISKQIIDSQQETFDLNNNLSLVNLQSEIDKMEVLISTDNEIISLREEIVKTAESQFKNGLLLASAYITEFTNLYESKSQLNVHKTQLLLNQIQYQITKGTYSKN